MSAYNKLFAAIISTLLSRWLFSYFGLDVEAMGVAQDLQMLVALGIDAAFAGVNGFFVWLIPNKETTPTLVAKNIKLIEPEDGE